MFFQFGVAVMGSEFLSNSLSSWLMVLDPWIPMVLGWAIIIVGVLLALTLPETMHAFPTKSKQHAHELSDMSTDGGDHDTPRFGRSFEKEARPKDLRGKIKSAVSTYSFITENKQVMLLLSAFLVYRLSRGTSWFLTQYVSVRYGWTIASANMLVSLKSILMVILFIAVLPAASWYLINKRGIESRQKDLILTKASVISLLVGTLGIGLSPHVAVMIFCLIIQTLGAGFVYTTRSLVTTMIQRDQTARLYTAIEIIQAFGMILASPTMTTFFKWGLDLGHSWTGLAWMVAGVLFGVVAAVLWVVKLPPRPTSDEDEGIAL
jgi:MFS family permease